VIYLGNDILSPNVTENTSVKLVRYNPFRLVIKIPINYEFIAISLEVSVEAFATATYRGSRHVVRMSGIDTAVPTTFAG
jgi:hypothetical protein